MSEKYYLDTCIWRDYYENRSDRFRPLGEWAFRLIRKIVDEGNLILYSDLVADELRKAFPEDRTRDIFDIALSEGALKKVETSPGQGRDAAALNRQHSVGFSDAMHAILARDNGAILVTRDAHFAELSAIVKVRKPEDLL